MSRAERWLSKGVRGPMLAAAPALAILAFGAAYHEPWRDEVQALLVARETPWSELLQGARLEGSPPLFHFLLKLLLVGLPNRAALLGAGFVGSVILLTGTYAMVATVSESRARALGVVWLLALGDTYGYELGVVVRQYGLALGLLGFAVARFHRALQRRSQADALAGALFAALSTATATHAGCLAGGFVLVFSALAAEAGRLKHALGALLVYAPGIAVTLVCIAPGPDRVTAANEVLHWAPEVAAERALEAVVGSVASPGWWLVGDEPAADSLFLPSLAAVTLAALSYGASTKARRKLVLLHLGGVVAGAVPLLYVLVFRYFGSYRHRLFLWNPLLPLACAWLCIDRRRLGATRGLAFALLALRFAGDARTLGLDLWRDSRGLFSETGVVADLLPANAHVVTEQDWAAVGILLERPDIVLRSGAGRGREVRKLLWDRASTDRVPVEPLVTEECARATERTFFITQRPRHADPSSAPACMSPLPHPMSKNSAIVGRREVLDVYRVDCKCLLGR